MPSLSVYLRSTLCGFLFFFFLTERNGVREMAQEIRALAIKRERT